jgi:hypothetical protein
MSQSTDELTRSELRAIPGHYRRRVWLAFLIPALRACFRPSPGSCCLPADDADSLHTAGC